MRRGDDDRGRRLRRGGAPALPLPRRRADRRAPARDRRPPRPLRSRAPAPRASRASCAWSSPTAAGTGCPTRWSPGWPRPSRRPGAATATAAGPGRRRSEAVTRRAECRSPAAARRTVATTGPAAAGLVDWAAGRAGGRLGAGAQRPPARLPARGALEADFAELTAEAETLVAAATGLRAPSPARARVTDREGWVAANVASIQRLLRPDPAQGRGPPAPRTGAVGGRRARPGCPAPPGRCSGGRWAGPRSGWCWRGCRPGCSASTTCSSPTSSSTTRTSSTTSAPTWSSLESRYGFPPRQFRLWLALHEVTHRCQFTGVPWLRDHFLSLVDTGLEPMVGDPHRLAEALRRAAGEVRAGRSPLEDAGMLGPGGHRPSSSRRSSASRRS